MCMMNTYTRMPVYVLSAAASGPHPHDETYIRIIIMYTVIFYHDHVHVGLILATKLTFHVNIQQHVLSTILTVHFVFTFSWKLSAIVPSLRTYSNMSVVELAVKRE